MPDPSENPTGLFASIRKLLDTGLSLAQNRLELFVVELQEEKWRLVEILLWAFAAIVLGMMTLIMVTLTLIYLFWETAPLAVLLVFTALYGGATGGAILALRGRLKERSAFSATLAEMKKDRSWLGDKN